ncbi:tRNA pseudouridine(13) synthase TruD [Nanoarchaeota archaeon]
MYKIKQTPEDFLVREISRIKPSEEGRYVYFILKKRNYTTQRAIKHIANALHVPEKRFGFAGNKDKNAITEQLCSVNVNPSRIELNDIWIEVVGKGNGPILLGDLEGNEFEIIVRNIEEKPKKINKIINCFDEQRFSKNNVEVGRAIIKKDFKKAVELILEGKDDFDLREHDERDPAGALQKVPKTILKLFVHSYQSDIWNKTAEKFQDKEKLPLVGFGTEFEDKKVEKFVLDLLKKDGITQRDFIIKQLPSVSSEGSERFVFADVKDLEIGKLEDDELNKGKKKCLVKFKLQKGAYATIVVRTIFQSS